MFFPRRLAFIVALASAVPLESAAAAQTVVTVCGTDTAAGGTNFEAAAQAGGDIVIRCATGGDEIRLTRTHQLAAAVAIDGGGKVTLTGSGTGAMFKMPPSGRLTLKGMRVRNPPATPSDPSLYAGVVYGLKDDVAVDLTDVQVEDTRLPFAVRRLRARNSSFVRNGAGTDANLGVVMATEMELIDSRFENNVSRPFLTRWAGNALSQVIRGRIVHSVFKGNRRPAMWQFGTLVVEGSRFEANGDGTILFKPAASIILPDAGNLNDEAGPSIAGALELRWTQATIQGSQFRGNKGLIGGAIFIVHAEVRLQATDLDANEAGAGGAIASVHVPPRPSEPSVTMLDMVEVKMRGNRASHDGGALLANGDVSATALLISRNRAGGNGGAIAWIGPTLTLPASAPSRLRAELLAVPGFATGSLVLRRSFLVDNESNGAIVDGQQASMQLGNLLAARNRSAAGSAVIRGASLSLANVTLSSNRSAGLAVISGGTGARLVNTILADNEGGNCIGSPIASDGPNLQFPGTSCGAAIATDGPGLDSRFAPGLGSPARRAGAIKACAADPRVLGVDAYGDIRGKQSCSIGAIEAGTTRDLARLLPRGIGDGAGLVWFLLALLVFLLLCFLIGLIFGLKRRRGRRQAKAA